MQFPHFIHFFLLTNPNTIAYCCHKWVFENWGNKRIFVVAIRVPLAVAWKTDDDDEY